jgi:hypothetical protein
VILQCGLTLNAALSVLKLSTWMAGFLIPRRCEGVVKNTPARFGALARCTRVLEKCSSYHGALELLKTKAKLSAKKATSMLCS